MENKYYQPNSEDFNIGVECQVYYPREEVWKDRKIRHWEDLDEILSRFTTDNTSVRFKYLDEDDLLSLGLKLKIWDNGSGYFEIENYTIGIYSTSLFCTVSQNDYGNNIIRFSGNIKNKNEFQRLLKQLEIDAL